MKLKKEYLCEDAETQEWGRAGFSIIETEVQPIAPLFTRTDYSLVREALKALSEIEREVIFLKFWKRYDVVSIAEVLGLRMGTVEDNLNRAYAKLKAICLEHPEFSRTLLEEGVSLRLAA